jgi:creatinine amidohydrolase
MTTRATSEYRHEKLALPEINDAIELGKICILPCGAIEQHGPHLPLDADVVCPVEIARGAGRPTAEFLLVLPLPDEACASAPVR